MRIRLLVLLAVFILCTFAQAPGTYAGTWTSNSSGNGGKLTLTFVDAGLSAASFLLQGQEVKAKPVSSSIDGENAVFAFEYDLDGTLLRSSMQGTVTGTGIKGKYQSAPAAGGAPVDEGTWEVKRN